MFNKYFSTALLLSVALAIPAVAADQHLIIVSIGDSLAAGEGNPNSFNNGHASWLNAPCHRSVNNGRRFANTRINALDGVSTQFFDFSCSGAKIDAGLLGTQLTSQPDANNGLQTPQIDQVASLQHNVLHDAPIDILMISVGVNDVNFADVVTACLLPGDCTTSDAVHTARTVLASASFANAYDRLGTAIRTKLNVKKVYITEYPNEMAHDPGDFCGDLDDGFGDLSMVGVSVAENSFLFTNIMQALNTDVQAAANRNRWTFVPGPKDTFATHGYCNGPERRYENTLSDSFARQGNQNGTMHPNIAGHKAYADALVTRATTDFNIPMEAPRALRTVEANTGLLADAPLADGSSKVITVEVAQHAGGLTAVLQHRLVNDPICLPLIGCSVQDPPAFTDTPMVDAGAGLLNLFAATIPGPGLNQTLEYKVVIRATRGTQTVSTTTPEATISIGEVLVQQ